MLGIGLVYVDICAERPSAFVKACRCTDDGRSVRNRTRDHSQGLSVASRLELVSHSRSGRSGLAEKGRDVLHWTIRDYDRRCRDVRKRRKEVAATELAREQVVSSRVESASG